MQVFYRIALFLLYAKYPDRLKPPLSFCLQCKKLELIQPRRLMPIYFLIASNLTIELSKETPGKQRLEIFFGFFQIDHKWFGWNNLLKLKHPLREHS
jgi:hypothetical protein